MATICSDSQAHLIATTYLSTLELQLYVQILQLI
jgi:hypothetical protein